MFAVVGRAPLTAILMVFEVTGARDYQLILPLMLTATLGTFLAERFHPDSIYTMVLDHMGIRVRKTGEVDLLDTIDVGSVMASMPLVCLTGDTLSDVEERLHADAITRPSRARVGPPRRDRHAVRHRPCRFESGHSGRCR